MSEANRFRFRAWIPKEHWIAANGRDGGMYTDWQDSIYMESVCFEPSADDGIIIMQSTGLTDVDGVELFDDDVVYIAGYGDYVCVFPYAELYEAAAENDIGALKGNIRQNPELLT